MATDDYDPEDCQILPIPLDRETRANLVRVARFLGEQPIHVARRLLRDALNASPMVDAEIPQYDRRH